MVAVILDEIGYVQDQANPVKGTVTVKYHTPGEAPYTHQRVVEVTHLETLVDELEASPIVAEEDWGDLFTRP